MNKTDAITLLGGTPATAARAIGITQQAFGQWPDVLPSRLRDRVEAAIARKMLPPEAFRVEAPTHETEGVWNELPSAHTTSAAEGYEHST